MRVRVLYHDHCFDGAASAAYFSRFYKDELRSDAEFDYTGMAHKASQLFEDSLFDGEENAISVMKAGKIKLALNQPHLDVLCTAT